MKFTLPVQEGEYMAHHRTPKHLFSSVHLFMDHKHGRKVGKPVCFKLAGIVGSVARPRVSKLKVLVLTYGGYDPP